MPGMTNEQRDNAMRSLFVLQGTVGVRIYAADNESVSATLAAKLHRILNTGDPAASLEMGVFSVSIIRLRQILSPDCTAEELQAAIQRIIDGGSICVRRTKHRRVDKDQIVRYEYQALPS